MTDLAPNTGKQLEATVAGERWLRLPVKTSLITTADDLMTLLETYVRPHLQPDDLLLVSEKVVCVTQGRLIKTDEVPVSPLAAFLSKRVRTHVGTPKFRGLGHGTGPAMQLLIDEAGVLRTLFAAAVAAVTRPLGIKGAFYYIVGKQAKSIDCPMSWTIEEFADYAKMAPKDPNGVARTIRERFGVETIIVDANYKGAFSLGKSDHSITERFIQELLRDNPAGQDSEMTPFIIARKA